MESNSAEPPEHVDPDVALMLRVRDDDAVAFELLVSRFQGRIGRLMLGWVNSQESAEDLVQEVFLRVFRARKSYQPTAKLTTWIYRIANNVASNAVRDRSRRKEFQIGKMTGPSTTDVGIEHIALAASGAMPGRRVDSSERAVMVQQAIQALGERQRMAMMLSKFEGLCYQDIADTMGLSVKAVKSLLSRARVNLKQLLQPYIDEGSLPQRAILRDEATVELEIGSLGLDPQKSQAAEVRFE
jgi:RNA polymerase sigma-70 factor (ECF subfamily)